MPGIGIGLGLGMGAGRGASEPTPWGTALVDLRDYLNQHYGRESPRNQPLYSPAPKITATQEKPDGLTNDYFYKDAADLTYLGGGEQTYLDDYRLAPEATQSDTAGPAGDGLSTYSWRISATVNADRLGVAVLGGTSYHRFIIDGQYVDLDGTQTATFSGLNWIELDFGTKAERHVVVEMGLSGAFYGFSVAPGDTVAAGPSSGRRMIVLGDSITVGTGAGQFSDGFANVCGDLLGIDDVWACGVGGGGYVSTNGGVVYKLAEHLSDANDNGPWDIIIVALGLNDAGLDEDAQVTAEATACLTSLRENNPTAQIIVVGPWDAAAPSSPTSTYDSVKAAIRAGIPGGLGIHWLDPEGIAYTKADAVHPDRHGHKTLGEWLGNSTARVLGVSRASPVNTVLPEITSVPQSGSFQSGYFLTCNPGTWTGIPLPEFAFQWRRDGTPIDGATSAYYLQTEDDVGAMIDCGVLASNVAGSSTAYAAAVGPVESGEPWSPLALEPALVLDASIIETMFQESAGTTPVTASTNPVGAMLDVSSGSAFGEELVTNGQFDTDASGWTPGTNITLSSVDGALRITRGATMNEQAYQGIATEIGKKYRWMARFKDRSTSAGNLRLECRAGETPTTGGVFSSLFPDVGATVSRLFTATSTTTYLRFLIRDGASGDWIEIDDVSVQEVGTVATQSDSSRRPLYLDDPPRVEYDFDDALVTVLPDLGSDCTIAYAVPGVGAVIQTGQAISGTKLFAQNFCWMAVIPRALTGGETLALTAWLNERSGV